MMHNGAAAHAGTKYVLSLELLPLLYVCVAMRKPFCASSPFFNHALNHFSGDELRTGV